MNNYICLIKLRITLIIFFLPFLFRKENFSKIYKKKCEISVATQF